MRLFLNISRLLLVALALGQSAIPALAHAQTGDLMASLAAQGSLNQFVRDLDSTGLSDTLHATGPYTVWAPTDDAYARLSPELRARLKDPTVLKQVLQYHLAPGVVTAAQIVQVPNVRTLEGEQVKITASTGVVRINDSRVVQPDLAANNGIIHVIDGLLIPPSEVAALPNTGSVDTTTLPLAIVGLGMGIAMLGLVVRRTMGRY